MTAFDVHQTAELSSITETPFTFSDTEELEGVRLVQGSTSHQIWELLSTRDPVLEHPHSGTLGTIEDFARHCASVYETEIYMHAKYCSIADSVAYIDARTRKGVDTPELDRTRLMQDSDAVFTDWELTLIRARQLKEIWRAYRNDRLKRVEKAIKLCRTMQPQADGSTAGHVSGEWLPDTLFVASLEKHALYLKLAMEMTKYYLQQNCVAKLTGRPLFSTSELFRGAGVSLRPDEYYMGLIGGSLQQRLALTAVAK